MALPATTVLEVRTGGNDLNGGGYKSDAGTTDYSKQDAAQLTIADGPTAGIGETLLESATGGFAAGMIGNLIHLYSGVNLTDGWYRIVGVPNASNIYLDRAPSDGGGGVSSANGKVGGALATPGNLGFVLNAHGVSGMQAYIKAGTYNLANTDMNAPGGVIDLSANMADKACYIEGYESTRGDFGTRPLIDANGYAPVQFVKLDGAIAAKQTVANLHIDGNSQNSNGISGNSSLHNRAVRCLVEHCDGIYAYNNVRTVGCKAFSCAAIGFYGDASFCWADACTGGTGFVGGYFNDCLASNGVDGFTGSYPQSSNCVSYNNSSDGFVESSGRSGIFVNCLSVIAGAYAWNNGGESILLNCAHYQATSGRTQNTPDIDDGAITLTGDPFTDAAAGDFSLNNTAGAGAVLREAGFSPFGQTGFADIGAVQVGGGMATIVGG